MSGFEAPIAGAAVGVLNSAVKAATGKSIVSHCKSAAKGLRNIVLQKAGEKASKEAEELLFNKKERVEFERRLDSLEYLLDDVASNSAMAADPSVVAELEALCSVLKKAASARLDADGRSDALTAIDRHMNSLHLALAANTNKKIQNVEEKLDGVVDGVIEKVGQRLDGAVEKIGANVEQKLDGAVDRIERKIEQKFDVFLSFAGKQLNDSLLAAFNGALAKVLPLGCEIANLFAEARGTRQVHRARVAVDDKASLDALRDRVVLKTEDDSLENAFNKALQTTGGERISVNRGAFLESYEQTVMRFTKLTEHQREKLETVRREPVAVLLAHAGAGKTFFAIQRMAQVLNSDPRAMLLFVARNTALAFFVCKWLVYASQASADRIVDRVHVLVAPFEDGPRRVRVEAAGARRRLSLGSAGKCEYALVVVDEAHHLAGEPKLHEQLKKVRAAEATLLFLSDASQATEATPDAEKLARSLVNLPRDQAVAVATLSEVVRSTKRIVAGAAAFQLDAGRKAEMSTYTASPGPPLVARIFPVEDDTDDIYAREVVEAIAAIRRQLADLDDLDDRVAVVGPDDAFVERLRGPLDRALDSFAPMSATLASTSDPPPAACGTYVLDRETGGGGGAAYYCAANGLYLYERSPGSWCVGKTSGSKSCKAYESPKGWSFYLNKNWTLRSDITLTFARFELVDASTASAVWPRAETEARDSSKQWLVVDTVDNMDGLERLVVICVGLDQVIDRGAGVLETRSRLYRAMTRAQLAVAVVNEALPGGWLEFLGHVELSTGDFDDAAERGNRAETAADDVVGAVVEETPSLSRRDFYSSFFKACKGGHVDAARLLLDNGAEVDRANMMDETPLYMACENGHVDAARLLLEKGAEVDRAEKNGQTPLFIACSNGHVDTARLLLEKGAAVDRATKDGATPLYVACQWGRVDAARLLLDKGAEVDRERKKGGTPLYAACWGGHVNAARLLLDNGAEIDQAREDGQTPLYIACENGRVDAARLLLDNGAEVDRADKDGWTPLFIACSDGHVDVARLLLECGADVDGRPTGTVDSDSAPGSGEKSKGGWRLEVSLLFATRNDGNKDPVSLRYKAPQLGQRFMAETASLEFVAPSTSAGVRGRGAVAHFEFGPETDVRKLLREAPLDVEAVDHRRRVVAAGRIDLAAALDGDACCGFSDKAPRSWRRLSARRHEADVELKRSGERRFVLTTRVVAGRASDDARSPTSESDSDSDSHSDWKWGLDLDSESQSQSDPDSDSEVVTPLLIACEKGDVDVARLLLDKGAEVDRADKHGQTPLAIAQNKGHAAIVAMLEQAGLRAADKPLNAGDGTAVADVPTTASIDVAVHAPVEKSTLGVIDTAVMADAGALPAPVAEKAAADANTTSIPSEAEPMKFLQSIWDASAVATASRGYLRFMPFSKVRVLATLKGHSKAVNCVAISPDGRRVVSASDDKTLKVWDVATGKCVATLGGHSHKVNCVAVFPDGRRVVSGDGPWEGAPGEVKVWDVATGECLATLEGHSSAVWGVAVSPDGRRIVSCGNVLYEPEVVKVWDVATGKCVAMLEGHGNNVWGVAVSPDGRRVVSGSSDHTIKVWDIETGECVATLGDYGRSGWVHRVAVFPNGRRVVSVGGTDDNTLKVWDVATGKCVATLEGHLRGVNCVAVFPDGRRVVSGSDDKTLKVWDVATGKCVATLHGHSDFVLGVAVSPDGRRVVACDGSGVANSVGLPGTVKVWEVPES